MVGEQRGNQPTGEPRVALFGGSFDPPHRGHIEIARAAARALALDCVLFTPTGLQPLKPLGASASFADRLAMVALLCASEPHFTVSDLDAPRSDRKPNYTVTTLEALRDQLPDARLFAIAGADSFLELPKWREAQRLLRLAEWIVVSRPGFLLEGPQISPFLDGARSRIHVLSGVEETVSATELRVTLARGEDCSAMIPAGVLDYIRERHLYAH